MAFQGGFGGVVQIDVTATPTTIAKAIEIGSYKRTRTIASVTAHDSTSKWQERLATGRRNVEPFDVTVLFDKASTTHAALQAGLVSGSTVNIKWKSPDGSQEIYSFTALITKRTNITDQEDGYKATFTVEPAAAATKT